MHQNNLKTNIRKVEIFKTNNTINSMLKNTNNFKYK